MYSHQSEAQVRTCAGDQGLRGRGRTLNLGDVLTPVGVGTQLSCRTPGVVHEETCACAVRGDSESCECGCSGTSMDKRTFS